MQLVNALILIYRKLNAQLRPGKIRRDNKEAFSSTRPNRGRRHGPKGRDGVGCPWNVEGLRIRGCGRVLRMRPGR